MALSNGDNTTNATRFPDVLARIGGATRARPVDALGSTPVRAGEVEAVQPVRVLVVTARATWRKSIVRVCLDAGMLCEAERTGAAAVAVLGRCGVQESETSERNTVDVVIVDADALGRDEVLAAARKAGAAAVLAASKPSATEVIHAMRLGVSDVLERSGKRLPPEVGEKILALANGSRNLRLGEQRICALRRMCRRLNASRREVVRQVDALCSDLLVAYQEIEAHMNQVSTATEFKGLIKGELDIEALLRTTLEFVLSRSGPTNAAVFLPTTSGDYSLGAYVNYDCPKDTCDVLLDHLANVIAPKFERTTGLINLTTPEQLERYIADDADWLNGSNVVGYACRHEGEVLAIFMLFRDRKSPFAQNVLDQVKTVGELFAAQLARVIHIHHRHLPKDKWGMMGDPNEGREDDYGDLAA